MAKAGLNIDIPDRIVFIERGAVRNNYDRYPALCFTCAVKRAVAGSAMRAALLWDNSTVGGICDTCGEWLD